MKSINRDTVCALVLLVFSGVFFWSSTGVKDMGYESIGSEIWPQIILGVLTVLSLIYLVRSLGGPLQNPDDAEIAVRPAGVSWLSYYRNVIISFILFGVFLVTLPYLGMLVGGVLFVFVTLCALGGWSGRKLISHAAIALLAVGVMWAVFTYGLNVILPQGELLRIL